MSRRKNSGILVVSTTMYAAECARSRLALQAVEEAVMAGHGVFVADKSYAEFKGELIKRGANVFDQAEGMGPGRRDIIARGLEALHTGPMGRMVLVWTELEKERLMHELEAAAQTIFDHHAQIVIPRRSERAWKSHPALQKRFEAAGNLAFQECTGHPKLLDVFMGPRLMTAHAAWYFLAYNGEYGDNWDSIFAPLVKLIADGVLIDDYLLQNYSYPFEQLLEEQGNLDMIKKRAEQCANLVQTFVAQAKKLGLPRTQQG